MQKSGTVSWKCPSNIALVKYWGKFGRQYPKNPSISFTLNASHTITEVQYNYDENRSTPALSFLFEGFSNQKFAKKIEQFLNGIVDIFPLVKNLELNINSRNSFPHSSGIASSASSMAALAMCLVSIEKEIKGLESIDLNKASLIARLGSGSACRSVFPKIAVWGENKIIKGSSNDYAIPYYKDIHPIFLSFRDDILIVSHKEKSVSSRAGHALMNDNPYANTRFLQANNHLDVLVNAMKDGDLDTFGMIVEKEALTLHALMMASEPPYILLEPNTINIIRQVQKFRKNTMVPVYFTLDAGPNIHLLYPEEFSPIVNELKADLKKYCADGKIIDDGVGEGPQKL
ncbi:MAG: diphosphomevalonate decarboxylase [Saprospiraceae bacterium]|nr:diphosphomevalonate decarboxylase [Bacteroidia bacterium]NNL93673.1 diphosphomevalonate decarboxylase [Saprospiraceae bacterium]